MKRALILFLCVTVIFSCKKEKKTTPEPEPEPVKTGTVNINVICYDTLGNIENDFSGVRVTVGNTALSATTTANGKITFENVPYGSVAPALQKPYYEGAPTSVNMNSSPITMSLPFARYCTIRVDNIVTQAVGKDEILVTINLNRPIPAGQTCKIALISSDTSLFSANVFKYVDTLRVTTQYTQKFNIAFLQNFRMGLGSLKKDKAFFYNMIPVSYGPIYSNILEKTILLGDNLFPPPNSVIVKNWD